MAARLGERLSWLDDLRGPVTGLARADATAHERQRAFSPFEAARILRSLGDDRDRLGVLTQLVGTRNLEAAIETGALLFVPGWYRPVAERTPALPPAEVASPPRVSRARKAAFELTVREAATGRPLVDVPLDVQPPDGSTRRLLTDRTGTVRIDDLDPGRCTVTSVIEGARASTSYVSAETSSGATVAKSDRGPKGTAHLVEVERHRIGTGQTPASIARRHGLSWETIALFNWGSTDVDELDRHYRETLGCKRRTPDGQGVLFDDGDDPGILLIPQPWESSLAVATGHELFVAPLRPLFLTLTNEAGLALPGIGYQIHFSDGSQREGSLGRSGVARLDGVPAGAFSVSYPDELDILAKSMAVSVRRAFDQQVAAPLFTLLMQEQEVVERAAAAYDRYLNDLTGKGLVADIDQVVTDPEARQPLLALCALAGLGVEGAAQVGIENNSLAGVDPRFPRST